MKSIPAATSAAPFPQRSADISRIAARAVAIIDEQTPPLEGWLDSDEAYHGHGPLSHRIDLCAMWLAHQFDRLSGEEPPEGPPHIGRHLLAPTLDGFLDQVRERRLRDDSAPFDMAGFLADEGLPCDPALWLFFYAEQVNRVFADGAAYRRQPEDFYAVILVARELVRLEAEIGVKGAATLSNEEVLKSFASWHKAPYELFAGDVRWAVGVHASLLVLAEAKKLEDVTGLAVKWPNLPAESTGLAKRESGGAFPAGVGSLATNPLTYGAFSAVSQAGPHVRSRKTGWSARDGGAPVWLHRGKNDTHVMVYVSPDSASTSEDLWKHLQLFGPLSIDVMLAVCAELGTGAAAQPVAITPSAILKYKGIARYGRERAALEAKIKGEVERLRALRIDIHWREATSGPGAKREIILKGDKLFDVVDVVESSHGNGRLFQLGWFIRPGQWGAHWLVDAERMRLCRFSAKILELDHREQRPAEALAKKIAVRLLLLPSQDVEMSFEKLLTDAGERSADGSDHHWAGRIRRRTEDALLKLEELGLIRIEWPVGHEPGSSRSTRGWSVAWLQAKVKLHKADLVTRHAVAHSKPQHALPPAKRRPMRQPKGDFSGPVLKKAREAAGIHQRELARALGVSQSLLSHIEAGRRRITDDMAKKAFAITEGKTRRVQ